MNDFGGHVKKIACVHDMSCLGRCALSVVMPVLSVMGNQAVPLPTALLSTHTGGFEDFTFLDLTCEMEKILVHWKKLGTSFDAVYSGFLGSMDQIGCVSRLIREFTKDDSLILVDPVLGDDGRLYRTITDGLCRGMRELVSHAHVITPNTTEALILLGLDPADHDKPFDPTLLERLCDLGPRRVAVTGVHMDGKVGTASYDAKTDVMKLCMRERIARSYPGTGDIFASVLLGRMLRGDDIHAAAEAASDYVCLLIRDSAQYDDETRYGVALEAHLGELCI